MNENNNEQPVEVSKVLIVGRDNKAMNRLLQIQEKMLDEKGKGDEPNSKTD